MTTQIRLGALNCKENTVSMSPTKEMRKLRVELSDKVFEIRKMQEDYAEEKAHLHMNHNSEKNQLNETIKELKQKLADENEHWSAKVDQIRKDHIGQIETLNEEWINKIQSQIEAKTKLVKENFLKQNTELISTVARLEAAVKNNKKRFDSQIFNLKEAHKRQIGNLVEERQKLLMEQRKNIEKDEDLKINAIMHIKNSEEKEHRKTKELLEKSREQFEQYKAKNQIRIFELRQEIWALKKQLASSQEKIQEKEIEIEKLDKKSKQNVQMGQKEYEQKIKNIEQGWKNNITSLNEKWSTQYKKLQLNLQKAQNAMNEKEKLWEERGNKVLQLYTKREARQEDVKLIENLEIQLIRKQFELEREKQELKSCKMELDNMDDIYKRIFHSAHKNNRHSASFHLKKVKLPGILNRSTNPLKNTIDH